MRRVTPARPRTSMSDPISTFLARTFGPTLGGIVVSSPIWLYIAVQAGRAVRRRREFREFAAARRFEFVGTIQADADAHRRYARVPSARRGTLLTNLIEGQRDGLSISVFNVGYGRRRSETAIMVTVDYTLRRGADAERVIATRPEAIVDVDDDMLLVTPRRLLDASELDAWLSLATTLALAMERDAKAFYASPRPTAG